MTFGDKIIIGGILAVSIAGIFFVNIFLYGTERNSVIIEVNGQLYAKYDFNQITSNKFVEIKTQYGYNKVEINKNSVRIVEASCPDKLDVKAGWISKSNQMLVCLPNRLVVKIQGKDTRIDGVAY